MNTEVHGWPGSRGEMSLRGYWNDRVERTWDEVSPARLRTMWPFPSREDTSSIKIWGSRMIDQSLPGDDPFQPFKLKIDRQASVGFRHPPRATSKRESGCCARAAQAFRQ